MICIRSPEDARQYAWLTSVAREEGAGQARYAAAMHFHAAGMLAVEVLEVYRSHAKRDAADPAVMLRER